MTLVCFVFSLVLCVVLWLPVAGGLRGWKCGGEFMVDWRVRCGSTDTRWLLTPGPGTAMEETGSAIFCLHVTCCLV